MFLQSDKKKAADFWTALVNNTMKPSPRYICVSCLGQRGWEGVCGGGGGGRRLCEVGWARDIILSKT